MARRKRRAPKSLAEKAFAAIGSVKISEVVALTTAGMALANSVKDAASALMQARVQTPPISAAPAQAAPAELLYAAGTLGLAWPCSAEQVKAEHRKMVQLVHTDRGGDETMSARVNTARTTLLRALGVAA